MLKGPHCDKVPRPTMGSPSYYSPATVLDTCGSWDVTPKRYATSSTAARPKIAGYL